MRNSLLLITLASCFAGAAHAQIFKCVEDGKTVYQGVAYRGAGGAITVEPASGPAAAPAPAPGPEGAPDAVTKLKENVKSMEAARKKRETDYTVSQIGLAIRDLEGAIGNEQVAMSAEIAALRAKKQAANNNLAGATWEQSISTEMQAVSEKDRTRIQTHRDRITQLRADAADLQKSK